MNRKPLNKSWRRAIGIALVGCCISTASLAQQNPVLINPIEETVVQRCFIEYNQQKKTECAAVGDPTGMHYVVDLSNGSILNTWRGAFIDAANMWVDRGQKQVVTPLGKVVVHSDKPAFAKMGSSDEKWPDSIQEGFIFKGYEVLASGRPVFNYLFKGIEIADKIEPESNHEGLKRTLSFENQGKPIDISFLLAESNTIKKVAKNLYAIGDLPYHIKINGSKGKVSIVKDEDRFQLVTQAGKEGEINYSIIW